VDRVVNALIALKEPISLLNLKEPLLSTLPEEMFLKAVQMSVNPKVIETPVVAAIAKDGIELRAKARVTVRAILTVSSEVPVNKPSLPVSAKVLLRQLVPLRTTNRFSKILMPYPKQC